MKAMVLAAGLGTRLRPATDVVPKPLFPVLGIPVVEWAIAGLRQAGVTEAIVNLHHCGAAIARRLGDGRHLGVALAYSEEPTILGTGGALAAARSFLHGDGGFFLHNADIFTDWDLAAVREGHDRLGGVATLALYDGASPRESRRVEVGQSGDVVGLRGRPVCGDGPRYVYTGVSILTSSLFDVLPPTGASCLVEDGLIPMLSNGGRVAGILQEGLFCDIGTTESYLSLQWEVFPRAGELFLARGMEPPREIAPGVLVTGSPSIAAGAVLEGPVLLCDGVRVEAGANVGPRAILGANSVVSAGARIANAVVFEGVVVSGPAAGIIVV